MTSVLDKDSLLRFINEVTEIIENEQLDLRGWVYTEPGIMSVFGLDWNPKLNVLHLNRSFLKDVENVGNKDITKV